MDSFEKKYLYWLASLVKLDDEKYSILFETLWNKEFYSIFPNDDNREIEGRQLREKWSDKIGIDFKKTAEFGPCRVIEMLIALSQRMEFELYGSDYNKTSADLFWEFVNNLGLKKYTNKVIVNENSFGDIDMILTRWLDRKYDRDGFGGIFPLKYWAKSGLRSQYDTEIWYQMCAYLAENYPI